MKTYSELENFAKKNHIPIIRKESGAFLQNQIEKTRPKKVLEIGTAIGYSGLLILNAYTGCNLVTIEKNKDLFDKANKTFEENNLTKRVKTILGDANEVLNELASQKDKFDFIFLDGPKGQYIRQLEFCKILLKKGGILFVDNVNHDGLVFCEQKVAHKHRSMIMALRKFVGAVQNDKQLQTQFYDIEDGVCICKKIDG